MCWKSGRCRARSGRPRRRGTPTPAVHHPAPIALTPSLAVATVRMSARSNATPTGFYFTGTATVQGMGRVDVTAAIHGVGFGRARAAGQLTLSNLRRSVTVALTGPEQPALARLPSRFHYRVVGAT